jgi:hypothetical protein
MEIVDRVYVALDALEAVGRPGEIGAEQLSSVDVRFQQHRKRLALAEMGRFLDCLTGRPMADLGRVQSDCFAITASASRIGCTGWKPASPLSDAPSWIPDIRLPAAGCGFGPRSW